DFYIDTLGFLNFINEILLKDNIEIIESIKNNKVSRGLLQKMSVIDNRAWKFNKKFAKSFPGEYFIYEDPDEVRLGEIFGQIDSLVTSLMDYKNMSERLEDFIYTSTIAGSEDEDDIMSILLRICSDILNHRKIFLTKTEDDINTHLKILLKQNKEVVVYDQTRQGESSRGKTLGEIDLKIEFKNKVFIVEALKLEALNKAYIIDHINRLKKYDKSGNRQNFIIVYYQGKQFGKFISGYQEFLCSTSELDYQNIIINNNIYLPQINIKAFDMYYRNGEDNPKITHIIINFSEK
ncbi:TPA: hypothetical protein ACHVI3_002174, partial [Streptococcus suis]